MAFVGERELVEVIDMLGRQVTLVFEGPLGTGEHPLALEGHRLPSGPYTVHAVGADGVRLSLRLIVVR